MRWARAPLAWRRGWPRPPAATVECTLESVRVLWLHRCRRGGLLPGSCVYGARRARRRATGRAVSVPAMVAVEARRARDPSAVARNIAESRGSARAARIDPPSVWPALEPSQRLYLEVHIGLGRITALYHRSFTVYFTSCQIHEQIYRLLYF